MGDLSENFNAVEFRCKCGQCENIDISPELIMVLQDIRDYFNEPVKITSGYRCKFHNISVGGSKKSRHVLGIAADFQVKNIKPVEVRKYINEKYPHSYGLGAYKEFVHLDVRKHRTRWSA